MVAVIEGKEEAGGARYIEFEVRRSPENRDFVVGSWRFDHGDTMIEQNKPGGSAKSELPFAVDCADRHGIPFVWVNDPEELFPPWDRR